jgi:L-seryl-tRNA(Ser) seleniumtransferase
LVPVAAEAGVPLLFDFGSGLVRSLEPYGLAGEPDAPAIVRDGTTLVLMSGDKLMGGPQAGVIVGTREAVAELRRHPLARAMRVDKLTIAGLHATLLLHRDPARAVREIPALAMITQAGQVVAARAEALASALRGVGIEAAVRPTEGSVGGGAFPSARLASWAVALPGDAVAIEARLRAAPTPVIARIADATLLLDLRSVQGHEDALLRDMVVATMA